jgi:2-polyprenyl-6-methoxyphenol hydroxylase-like FAD-dependent oxidoreductase
MKSTQVLVVGAGPVGFLAALCLRAHGVDVTVVDDNERTDAKSFAVVLHPRTVALLADLGITSPLLWQGQSFERVVVYSEAERRATLEMLVPNAMARGGLTLPRNVLRRALEAALRDQAVEVLYRHRLISLERGQRSVRARLSRGDSMPELNGSGFAGGCSGFVVSLGALSDRAAKRGDRYGCDSKTCAH